MQYMRLDGTNFSKNSCNRACATENETLSLELMLDKSQMLLAIVLALFVL
jgi:hypothetical protein